MISWIIHLYDNMIIYFIMNINRIRTKTWHRCTCIATKSSMDVPMPSAKFARNESRNKVNVQNAKKYVVEHPLSDIDNNNIMSFT